MKVILNNTERELAAHTSLQKALDECSIPTTGVAVAVNQTVVPKAEYNSFELKEGDDILIIKAFYGG